MAQFKLHPMPLDKTEQPTKNQEGILPRYSDEDLGMFKKLVEEKLHAAETEYNILLSALKAEIDGPKDKGEEGRLSLSKEEASELAQRQYKFVRSLRCALIRIENKTYGICRETGKLIPKERLLLVPHATMCMEAKNLRGK